MLHAFVCPHVEINCEINPSQMVFILCNIVSTILLTWSIKQGFSCLWIPHSSQETSWRLQENHTTLKLTFWQCTYMHWPKYICKISIFKHSRHIDFTDLLRHSPITETVNSSVAVPTSFSTVTRYFPPCLPEDRFTVSVDESAVVSIVTSPDGATALPLHVHITVGLGSPLMSTCRMIRFPALMFWVPLYFLSWLIVGAAGGARWYNREKIGFGALYSVLIWYI